MSSVPHLGFIIAAYAVTVVTIAATILMLVQDQRAQKRLLARFPSRSEE